MHDKKFILTCDAEVCHRLKKLGFQEIPSANVDIFIFVNDSNLLFTDEIDMSKIQYSNKLFF